jgi:short subunit dehydrogenase-like uncharacterized protein
MTDELLIYGAYGYTGALVAETAVENGLSPVLAGRTARKVERQATDLGLDHRVFSLQHPEVVERQVEEFSAVLNCAGPFSETAEPMYSACLRAGTDYLDITGEADVLEAIAERDRDAEEADVTLLPAVGFDVVSTDWGLSRRAPPNRSSKVSRGPARSDRMARFGLFRQAGRHAESTSGRGPRPP